MKTKLTLGKSVKDKVSSSVYTSVNYSLYDTVRDLVEILLRGLFWESLYNSVNISVYESIHEPVNNSIKK